MRVNGSFKLAISKRYNVNTRLAKLGYMIHMRWTYEGK